MHGPSGACCGVVRAPLVFYVGGDRASTAPCISPATGRATAWSDAFSVRCLSVECSAFRLRGARCFWRASPLGGRCERGWGLRTWPHEEYILASCLGTARPLTAPLPTLPSCSRLLPCLPFPSGFHLPLTAPPSHTFALLASWRAASVQPCRRALPVALLFAAVCRKPRRLPAQPQPRARRTGTTRAACAQPSKAALMWSSALQLLSVPRRGPALVLLPSSLLKLGKAGRLGAPRWGGVLRAPPGSLARRARVARLARLRSLRLRAVPRRRPHRRARRPWHPLRLPPWVVPRLRPLLRARPRVPARVARGARGPLSWRRT